MKVLIFTGEILNEKLWVDVLDAGCDGIILKSGELLTRGDVASCMGGKKLVFNQPILQKIVDQGADYQPARNAFRRKESGEATGRTGSETLP